MKNATRRLVPLTQTELHLVCDALFGYSRWLEQALSETHSDLKKTGRNRRHDERVKAAMFRGELYKRFSRAAHE